VNGLKFFIYLLKNIPRKNHHFFIAVVGSGIRDGEKSGSERIKVLFTSVADPGFFSGYRI
jgi:hypothetical protein